MKVKHIKIIKEDIDEKEVKEEPIEVEEKDEIKTEEEPKEIEIEKAEVEEPEEIEVEKEPTEDEKEFSSLASINMLIKNFLNITEDIKSVVISLSSDDANDAVIDLLNMIYDDTAISVGVLQRALELSTDVGQSFEAGRDLADDTALEAEIADEDSIEDEKNEPEEVEKELKLDFEDDLEPEEKEEEHDIKDEEEIDDTWSDDEAEVLKNIIVDLHASDEVGDKQNSFDFEETKLNDDEEEDGIDADLISVANAPRSR